MINILFALIAAVCAFTSVTFTGKVIATFAFFFNVFVYYLRQREEEIEKHDRENN